MPLLALALLACLAPPPGEEVRVWVHFTDKGPLDLDAELARLERSYSPRALKRRALRRTAPGLFDRRDVAVHAPYVERVAALGAEVRTASSWLNAASVEVPAERLAALRALPFVERVEPVRRLHVPPRAGVAGLSATGPSPAAGPSFYGSAEAQIAQIHLDAVHALGWTGAGVAVGILDTGFATTHDAFQDAGNPLSVLAEHDFVAGDSETGPEPGDPSSQHHHGTQVLGVVRAYLPGTLVGGAYDADVILAKCEDVLDETYAEEDLFVAGLQFLEAQGADVATSSLIARDLYAQSELDGRTSVMSQAFHVAAENGVHCFQGAGNEGHDADPATSRLQAPADALRVVTVGGVEADGTIAWFSSDGPTADGRLKPEVTALGLGVATVDNFTADQVAFPSGTSFAAPLAAAACACLVQAHPDWTVDEMRQALFRTAAYFSFTGQVDPAGVFGYGLLDAQDALGYVACAGPTCCFGVDCPCGNDDPLGGCANSTGQGARLAGTGTGSLSADDLVLTATGLPPENSGLFYMGDAVTLRAFFDGFQCASGVTFRLLASIQSSGGAGSLTHSGIAAEAGALLAPGATWHFQGWYRDVPGTPCGTGANLTNVLSVTFAP